MKKIFVLLIVLGVYLSACGGENMPDEGAPLPPADAAPGQGEWSRGEAFVNDAQLVIMESFPIQVAVEIQGELPTPCNRLMVEISEPDADNQINIDVYSLVNPAETCIAVIEPFSDRVSIPPELLVDGTYLVFVNGALIGEFTYPGG